ILYLTFSFWFYILNLSYFNKIYFQAMLLFARIFPAKRHTDIRVLKSNKTDQTSHNHFVIKSK
ncbi:hypothetical protein, partial [Serratia sarumanii]|uniref:hypothetical protein n=1 Tax=Serratia sarumanii TaxID=3020826 RepID=UPI003F7ED370